MKVKCINNKNLIQPSDRELLTVGNFYELVKIEYNKLSDYVLYYVIDNTNKMRFFDASRFEPEIGRAHV